MASLFELLGWIQWDDLEGQKSRESGVFEYSTSKLELIMMMRQLNKKLQVRPATPPPFSCTDTMLGMSALVRRAPQ